MGVGYGGAHAWTGTGKPRYNILANGNFRDNIAGNTGCPVFWHSNDVTFDTTATDSVEPGGKIINAVFAQDGYMRQFFGLTALANYTINPLLMLFEYGQTSISFGGWFKDNTAGLHNNITLGIYMNVAPAAPTTKEVSFTAPDDWEYHGVVLHMGWTSAFREIYGYITAPDAAGADLYLAHFSAGITDAGLYNSDAKYGHYGSGCHQSEQLTIPYFRTSSLTFGYPGSVSNNTFFQHHGVTTTAALQPAPGKRAIAYGLTLQPGTVPGGNESFQLQTDATALISSTYVAASGGRQTTLLDFSAGPATIATEADGLAVQCLTADASPGEEYLATAHLLNWTE